MQIVAVPGFYARCSGFANLRAPGLAAAGERDAMLHQRDCQRCDTLSVMFPVVRAFKLRAIALFDARDREKLAEVSAYLAARMGYRPNPIVIHLPKDGDQPERRIEF